MSYGASKLYIVYGINLKSLGDSLFAIWAYWKRRSQVQCTTVRKQSLARSSSFVGVGWQIPEFREAEIGVVPFSWYLPDWCGCRSCAWTQMIPCRLNRLTSFLSDESVPFLQKVVHLLTSFVAGFLRCFLLTYTLSKTKSSPLFKFPI